MAGKFIDQRMDKMQAQIEQISISLSKLVDRVIALEARVNNLSKGYEVLK